MHRVKKKSAEKQRNEKRGGQRDDDGVHLPPPASRKVALCMETTPVDELEGILKR